MSDAANPFEAPKADPTVPERGVGSEDDERIRFDMLVHEGAIQIAGWMWLGVGVLLVLSGLVMLLVSTRSEERFVLLLIGVGMSACILGVFAAWTGIGLKRISPTRRTPAVILSVLALPVFPPGTMMGLAGLYLLAGENGQLVLSEEYRDIIDRTPHIKPRWPMRALVVIVLAVLANAVWLFVSVAE